MNANAVKRLKVDMSKPRSQRPMIGLDIEEWRGELGLTKYDAQYALGFRNSNHYNKMCNSPLLPEALELLIRLYEEIPRERGWERFSIKELFHLMYDDALEPFIGSEYETWARVDLGTRFAKFFGRSSARQYEWLADDGRRNDADLPAYSVIECILSKLKQADDPKILLERVAKHVWQLRGVDIDVEFRVPTLSNPPTRLKTGRKSGTTGKARSPATKKTAEKSPAKAKTAKNALTPKAALVKAVKKDGAVAAKKPSSKKS